MALGYRNYGETKRFKAFLPRLTSDSAGIVECKALILARKKMPHTTSDATINRR